MKRDWPPGAGGTGVGYTIALCLCIIVASALWLAVSASLRPPAFITA